MAPRISPLPNCPSASCTGQHHLDRINQLVLKELLSGRRKIRSAAVRRFINVL
jgi:hypothetical protein